jgi:hypothetical protein
MEAFSDFATLNCGAEYPFQTQLCEAEFASSHFSINRKALADQIGPAYSTPILGV